MKKFLKVLDDEAGVTIRDGDYQEFISNKETIFGDIVSELSLKNIESLFVHNNEFLDFDFLNELSKSKTLREVHIVYPCKNAFQITEVFKKNNIDVIFCYDFSPEDKNYYNPDLLSYTSYPAGFRINLSEQEIVIDKDTPIDILLRLLKVIPLKSIKIEFNDVTHFKEVIDSIDCEDVTLYVNDIQFEYIDYAHSKIPSTKFELKGMSFFEYSEEISFEQLKKKDTLIKMIVQEVKSLNLSPLEMYMYLYNVVKNFKPYKEVNEYDNLMKSRFTELLMFNDFIVCEGYANLLEELVKELDDPNIRCAKYGFNLRHTGKSDTIGHARVLAYINDEKYGLDNVFVSDPTWDSIISHKSARVDGKFPYDENATYDWYNHFIMTPSKIRGEKAIEVVDDMILDIVDGILNYQGLVRKNKKSLLSFANNDIDWISNKFLITEPADSIVAAMRTIYQKIYQNYSPEMIDTTLKYNKEMSGILYDGSFGIGTMKSK